MRTALRFTALALVLVPSLTTLDAQRRRTLAFSEEPVTVDPAFRPGALTPAEVATLRARIATANTQVAAGNFREARAILRDVVSLQERGSAYCGPTLRMLANIEFAMDRALAAAALLERAADAAKYASDPVFELRALVDAVVIYDQEGRRSRGRDLVPRIRVLLDSPAIPDELRQQVARHLITE